MSILGIDEVGRGPLAGPLVVGAVILPKDKRPWFAELKDSKKLTAKKREILNNIIIKESATGLGWVSAKEIDKIGISKALRRATHQAVKSVQSLHIPFSQIIIDGKTNFLRQTSLENYTSTCVKGDDKIREISAASIIAKVARDQYMINLATKYPAYQFDRHVGYGTKAHIEAIYKYGLTEEHRKSFEPCKSLSNFTAHTSVQKNTTVIGQKAEQIVAEYLEKQGHTIIAKNHKTFFYEIDIISIKNQEIYFTEVKYRANTIRNNGLDTITKTKLHQMQFAAESYLKYQETKFKKYQPLLAAAFVTGNLSLPETVLIDWLPISE